MVICKGDREIFSLVTQNHHNHWDEHCTVTEHFMSFS